MSKLNLLLRLLCAFFLSASTVYANQPQEPTSSSRESAGFSVLVATENITLEEDYGSSSGNIHSHGDIVFEEPKSDRRFAGVLTCDHVTVAADKSEGIRFVATEMAKDRASAPPSPDHFGCNAVTLTHVGIKNLNQGPAEDLMVANGERHFLAPGRYGRVAVEADATLILLCGFNPRTSHSQPAANQASAELQGESLEYPEGETSHACGYAFDQLLLQDDAALLSFGNAAAAGHNHDGQRFVTVSVANELEIGEGANMGPLAEIENADSNVNLFPVAITMTLESAAQLTIGERANVRAQLVAPSARVSIEENAHLRGQLIAAAIAIAEDATFGPDEVYFYGQANQGSADLTLSDADLEPVQPMALPTEYALEENYPNPFNPTTTINYALPKPGEVTLAIYNMRGQLVRTLVKGSSPAGRFSASWNGRDDRGVQVASGVYVYRLTAQEFVSDKKLTLLK